jgi:hypothetical protein
MPNSDGFLGISKEKMDEFLKVTDAFRQIRDQRLYRAQYTSFDAYCRGKYGIPGALIEKFIAEAELERLVRKADPQRQ